MGPVPAGSSQSGGCLGNWQPTANEGAFDAGVGCHAAAQIPQAAAGGPRLYCAHTSLLSVAAKAPRIKFCPRKPMRQNNALQIFPQVKLYLYRHRVYHSSCAGIQPARPTPAPDPHQSTLRRMCNLYNAGLPLAILSSRRRWYSMPIRSGSKALILPMTRDYRWFQ